MPGTGVTARVTAGVPVRVTAGVRIEHNRTSHRISHRQQFPSPFKLHTLTFILFPLYPIPYTLHPNPYSLTPYLPITLLPAYNPPANGEQLQCVFP